MSNDRLFNFGPARFAIALVALLLALALAMAIGLGRGVPNEAQAQTPDQPDTQTPRNQPFGAAVTPQSPDASRLLQKAEREGAIRAIVGLRTEFVPEGRLSQPQAVDQQDAIENAGEGLRADLAGTGYRTLREYETVPYIALRLTPEAFREVQNSPRATTIQEDVAVPADLAESAPIVQAPTMWANNLNGAGRTIAILDTGVDRNHPFLAGKVVEEACFSGGSDCPNGQTTQTGAGSGAPCTYAALGCQHGTHVAGIAAGSGSNFSGVARGATIMSVQVFSRVTGAACDGQREDPCTKSFVSDQLAGLEYVHLRSPMRTFSAANMSLGGGQYFSNCDTDSLKSGIDNLRSAGIATVISSSNANFTNAVGFPGCISTAITVGATNDADAVASPADWGPDSGSNMSSLVDLLAPGSSINSSVPGGGFGFKSGTSMAAPHVSGAWAILEQWDAGQDVGSITSRLQSTGTPVTDTRPGGTVTARRINIADAAGRRPPNDGVGFSQWLGGGARVSFEGINGAATREPGEPDHLPAASSLGENSVWYSWTAPASGQVTMDTCTSSFDTVLAAYTGGSIGGLSQVASDDGACTSPNGAGSKVIFNAVEGTTYKIAVAGFLADTGGEGTFTLKVGYAPPPNDNFASAQTISGTSASVAGRNIEATREPGEPDHSSLGVSSGERSVWYRWTAPSSGPVSFNTCASDDDFGNMVLAAYTGSAVGTLSQVASDDACSAGRQLTFDAVAGTTYRIAVAGLSSTSEGTFTLKVGYVAPPPNDAFASTQEISGNNVSVGGTTLAATRESGEPDHLPAASSLGENSVWYSWTAPASGTVSFDTCTSSFDTVLAAYTGGAISGLTQVATNDNACSSPNANGSQLTFDAVAGTTYRIAVASLLVGTGSQGTFTLKVGYVAPPPNDAFAGAQTISGASTSVAGHNFGATREPGEPLHAPHPFKTGPSVWYNWTAPSSGSVTVDTSTSSFYVARAVYTGGSIDGLTEVAGHGNPSFDAVAGTTYRIAVAGLSSTGEGTFTLKVGYVALPPNDAFANSQAMSGGTTSINGTNKNATREPGEPAHGPSPFVADSSVWYSWTAPSSGSVTVDTCTSDFNSFLAAYTGGAVNALTEVANNDNGCTNGSGSKVTFDAQAGSTYRIAVASLLAGTGSQGTFALKVGKTPPPNDDFAKAQAISGANASVGGTTLGATVETGEPDHYVTNPPDSDRWTGDHSVWYSWTAPFSGKVEMNTCATSIDSILAVYTGTTLGGLSRVADDNNSCPSGWGSKATFNAQKGTTYKIAVSDAGGLRENTFTLKVLDKTLPTVRNVSPASGATGVASAANVIAAFSEPMRASTINATTVRLRKAGTTTFVTATVTYDAATRRAILNPNANLAPGATYIATVTTGVKDIAGNPLAANKTWKFTVE